MLAMAMHAVVRVFFYVRIFLLFSDLRVLEETGTHNSSYLSRYHSKLLWFAYMYKSCADETVKKMNSF